VEPSGEKAQPKKTQQNLTILSLSLEKNPLSIGQRESPLVTLNAKQDSNRVAGHSRSQESAERDSSTREILQQSKGNLTQSLTRGRGRELIGKERKSHMRGEGCFLLGKLNLWGLRRGVGGGVTNL